MDPTISRRAQDQNTTLDPNGGTFADKWASVDDLAEVRDGSVGRDTMYRLAREGRVPVLKLSKRRWFVARDWADRLEDVT